MKQGLSERGQRLKAIRRQLMTLRWPFLFLVGPQTTVFVCVLYYLGVLTAIATCFAVLTVITVSTLPLVALQFGNNIDIVAAVFASLVAVFTNIAASQLPVLMSSEELQFHHVASFIFSVTIGSLLEYRSSVFCAYLAVTFAAWYLMRLVSLEDATWEFHMKTTFAFSIIMGALCTMLRFLNEGSFQAGAEVERLRQHTQMLQGEVEDAKDQKHSFLAYIMHEVRNPLSAACLLVCEQESQIAEMREMMAKMREKRKGGDGQGVPPNLAFEMEALIDSLEGLSKTVQSQIDQIGSICNDVLHLEKLASGKFEYNISVNSLRSFFSHAAKEAAAVMKQKGVALKAEICLDPELSTAASLSTRADFPRLRQVISNFMSNARKFTPSRGLVIFRMEVSTLHTPPLHHAPGMCEHASQLPDSAFSFSLDNTQGKETKDTPQQPQWIHIRVSVKDSAVGIAPEDLPKLFRPYAQIRAGEQQKGGGTGLGLCICKTFVEAHCGGQIGALSAGNGSGSEFFFQFDAPLAADSQVRQTGTEPEVALCPPKEVKMEKKEKICLQIETFKMDTETGRESTLTPRRPFTSLLPESTFFPRSSFTPTQTQPKPRIPSGLEEIPISRDVSSEAPSFYSVSASDQEGEGPRQRRGSRLQESKTISFAPGEVGGGKAGEEEEARMENSVSLTSPTHRMRRASIAGHRDELPSSREKALLAKVEEEKWTRGRKYTADVLVVEDNPVCQMAVCLGLRRMGFSVEVSEDGSDAIDRFERGERYRLVLMDRNMPKVEGPEAISQILSQLESSSPSSPACPFRTQIPLFIGLTGQTEQSGDFEAAGAVKTIFKPVTTKNLQMAFEELNFKSRGVPRGRRDSV
uniref:histidine kinase n=1 Tax=Chromera velia CCMP2878 TaxID=1169474 RepID=A0A0G4F048_9ALVE|eukprot:Cvel_14343.t1-p1 / transcript=Cvel_14343.t1 / gene=Cvel_14343 / organism=Chromera_velia_CCMP2878 / gene_product=Hybrid signal transduction histidine kinase D, putative / transcript_product=Hybrid signal transduction histidine kinase D, putative / location=Cvel_scaffold1016:22137-25553(+) / protein_length=861 / sequence_SO=supercontig / SO=protein_coding / is_pseudo=false